MVRVKKVIKVRDLICVFLLPDHVCLQFCIKVDIELEVKYLATKIRLRRLGAKKNPFYRLVVADSNAPRDGRFIEEIGYYDPTKNPEVLEIDEEKALKWLGSGAQPSDTVKSLLRHAGVLAKFRSKN